jgi:lycopene beta-cyclase
MKMLPACDYVIVGGGLQGCLLTHALAHHQPEARVLLVERSPELCGNHTWSFHATDVPPEAAGWFDPLVSHRWPACLVRFPGLSRRVEIPYGTITSAWLRGATSRLHVEDPAVAGVVIRCGESCEIVSPTRVMLGGETAVDCRAVIDCRGRAATSEVPEGTGFQSFIGREYETTRPWPVRVPTIMDARADQAQGFEFLYELPFGPHHVLLEYTRFSEHPDCDDARADELISRRLAEAGVGPADPIRTERGCLPMPYARPARAAGLSVAGGYAGGWYHAATGYSMPLAIRFAELAAKTRPELLSKEIAAAASRDSMRHGFARFLNRLLFCLVKPADRWKIFRRFYRVLPDERIARFYGCRFNLIDASRIVIGRPPTGLMPLRFARSLLSRTRPVPT